MSGRLGGLLGGVTGAGMLGGGRRGGLGRTAGMGLLAALAYEAYQKHAAKSDAAQAAGDPKLNDAADAVASEIGDDDALLMVRAMIASANADGRVDDEERQRVLGHLGEAGANEGDRQFVERELRSRPRWRRSQGTRILRNCG